MAKKTAEAGSQETRQEDCKEALPVRLE